MEEQLNCYISMDAPDIPAKTVQTMQEKWGILIEIHTQLKQTGDNFISEASSVSISLENSGKILRNLKGILTGLPLKSTYKNKHVCNGL